MTRVIFLAFLASMFFSCKFNQPQKETQNTEAPAPVSVYSLTEAEQAEVMESMGEVGIEMDGETLEGVMQEDIDVDVEGLADKGLTTDKVDVLIALLTDKGKLGAEKIAALQERLMQAVEKSNSGKGLGARGEKPDSDDSDGDTGDEDGAGDEGAGDDEEDGDDSQANDAADGAGDAAEEKRKNNKE